MLVGCVVVCVVAVCSFVFVGVDVFGIVVGWAVFLFCVLPLGVVGCWGCVGCCLSLGSVVGVGGSVVGRCFAVVGVPWVAVVGVGSCFVVLGVFCCVVPVFVLFVVCCFVCAVLGVFGCVLLVVGGAQGSFPFQLPVVGPGLAEQAADPALSRSCPVPWVDFFVVVFGGLFLFWWELRLLGGWGGGCFGVGGVSLFWASLLRGVGCWGGGHSRHLHLNSRKLSKDG